MAMIASMWHSLGHYFDFGGGLSQTDWFSVFTGLPQTVYGIGAYNQAAYTANCAMRQAQLYQEKNYRLAWVTAARDDMREMMSVSVERVNNYNLVATLILGTAASALLGGVTFDTAVPDFIAHAFFLSISLSIAFFALSIMFGIKAQNSAFTNTVRLLTWELRPENPPLYTHDYMMQAQQYERDGPSELLRVPGVMPKYRKPDPIHQVKPSCRHRGPERREYHNTNLGIGRRDETHNKIGHEQSSSASSSRSDGYGDDDDDDPSPMPKQQTAYEELILPTRRLMYLKRFAHFMQLWMPLDWLARYSIGLGLISLAQGASYYSVAIVYRTERLYKAAESASLVAIFVAMTLIILEKNTTQRSTVLRSMVGFLFSSGPLCAVLVVALPTEYEAWDRVFAPLSTFAHWIFYCSLFIFSFMEKRETVGSANKLCTGPHGQSFLNGEHDPTVGDHAVRTSSYSLRASGNAVAASEGHSSGCGHVHSAYNDPMEAGGIQVPYGAHPFHGHQGAEGPVMKDLWPRVEEPGRPDAPSDRDLMEESKVAEQLQRYSRRTLQALIFLAAVVWGVLFILTCYTYLVPVLPWSYDGVLLHTIVMEVDYGPDAQAPPHSIACSQGTVFVANSFQVYRLVEQTAGSWRTTPYPCKGLGDEILDTTLLCGTTGDCHPMLLLRNDANHIHDCETGNKHLLLQNPPSVAKIALQSFGIPNHTINSTLVTSDRHMVLVQRQWSERPRGWKPLWVKMNMSKHAEPDDLAMAITEVKGLDLYKGYLFLFSKREGLWNKQMSSNYVQKYTLQSAQPQGKWFVSSELSVQDGCAMDSEFVLMLTDAGMILRARLASDGSYAET